MASKKVLWKRFSILMPSYWDGYDAETGVWVATLRPNGNTIHANVFPTRGREFFANVNFAKRFVEARYNAAQ